MDLEECSQRYVLMRNLSVIADEEIIDFKTTTKTTKENITLSSHHTE